MKSPSSLKWVRLAAKVADDKLGQNIAVLDVRKHSSVTDYFLFISASSHLHVRALEDAIREELRDQGISLKRTDGQRGHLWRVLDYGDMLIHIMDQKTREFYAIERLWDGSKKISLVKKSRKTKSKKSSD